MYSRLWRKQPRFERSECLVDVKILKKQMLFEKYVGELIVRV